MVVGALMHYPKKKICCRKGEHTEMNLTISKNHDQEIIDLIRKYNYDCVLGNHEEGFLYEVDKI